MNTPYDLARRLARTVLGLALLLDATATLGQSRTRTELWFPDLPGYLTLRCDLHLHTVFSDGLVWPSIRVEEAWRDGLDAIALTDHLEYLPHKNDIPTNYARPIEIARAHAAPLGLLVIPAAEITKGEPPGHLNALFLTNIAQVSHTNAADAVKAAFDQDAFLFWNHPGWKQPEQKSVWYDEQGAFLDKGWLHGLEVVNGTDYDPIVHQWCLDRKLTFLGNSDAHNPMAFDYGGPAAPIRPMTLVFAKARTPEAIKEALHTRRTVVFSQGRLIGEPDYLVPLFQQSIEIVNPDLRIRGKGRALVQIRNRAPLDFELRLAPKLPELDVQEQVTLAAGKVSLVSVQCVSDRVTGEQEVPLPCRVLNLLESPNRGLRTALVLKVRFEAAP